MAWSQSDLQVVRRTNYSDTPGLAVVLPRTWGLASAEANLMPSLRSYWTALLLSLLLTLAAVGCGRLTDSCGAERRDVTAATAESTSGLSDYATVILTQDRGMPGSFSWHIQGPILPVGEVDPYPYEEHVLAARLLDGGADMALLLELPVRVVEGLTGIGGFLPTYTGPISFDQLFDLVQAGRAVLDITTDIPGQERMLRPLETVSFRDWRRVPCD